MRIRKTYKSTVIPGKIVNSSTNAEDKTYSCKYINETISNGVTLNKDLRIFKENYYNIPIEDVTQNAIYSGAEIAIGRWINGKTIYRRVYEFTSGWAYGAVTRLNFNPVLPSLEMLVNKRVIYTRRDGTFGDIPTFYKGNDINGWGASTYDFGNTGFVVCFGGNFANAAAYNIIKLTVIVEYTKAS